MTEREALKMALEWYTDVTDGRPNEDEMECVKVLLQMYKDRGGTTWRTKHGGWRYA